VYRSSMCLKKMPKIYWRRAIYT